MSLDSWQCRWEGLDSVDRMQEQSWGWEGLTGMMAPYRTQSMEWSWLSLSVVSPRNFLIYGSVGYIYLWHTARDVSASWQTSSETNDVKPSEAKKPIYYRYFYFCVHHSLTEESRWDDFCRMSFFNSVATKAHSWWLWLQHECPRMLCAFTGDGRDGVGGAVRPVTWGCCTLCLSCSSLPFPHSSLVLLLFLSSFGICFIIPPILFLEWHITSITFFYSPLHFS